MNRSELINAFKEKTTLSRKDAEKVVDIFFGYRRVVELLGHLIETVDQHLNFATGLDIDLCGEMACRQPTGRQAKCHNRV